MTQWLNHPMIQSFNDPLRQGANDSISYPLLLPSTWRLLQSYHFDTLQLQLPLPLSKEAHHRERRPWVGLAYFGEQFPRADQVKIDGILAHLLENGTVGDVRIIQSFNFDDFKLIRFIKVDNPQLHQPTTLGGLRVDNPDHFYAEWHPRIVGLWAVATDAKVYGLHWGRED